VVDNAAGVPEVEMVGEAAATVRMRFPLVTARDPVVLAAKPDPATVIAPGVPDTPVALPDLTMSV
jgi:hypothetical protein